LLQLLHGFYRGSDGILENGTQNKKLNFLVFCRNAGPPLPNKSCNHQLLQLLHGFYRGSDGILENGPQNKKLNFLVFCRNAGPPLPNKSCNHPCKSGARCTDRCFQSEEMCSKKDPPPKKLNFLRFLGPSQHIPSPLVCKVGPAGVPLKNPSTTEHGSLSTLLLGGRGKHVTKQNIKKLSFLGG